jgi:hypothetical protein
MGEGGTEMKKMLLGLVVAAALLTSCTALFPTGKAGKTYISYDRDRTTIHTSKYDGYSYTMNVYKAYLDLPGFPSSVATTGVYFNTDYPISTGSYTGTALLYALDIYNYSYWRSGGSGWYATNDISTNSASWLLSEATTFDYTITANAGTSGFLKGVDGADKYYSIYLTWDPANWAVTSKGVKPMASKVISATSDKIVKEFKDEANTITLTIHLNSPATGNGLPDK